MFFFYVRFSSIFLLCSYQFFIYVRLCLNKHQTGPGYWKFNNALLYYDNYVAFIRNKLQTTQKVTIILSLGGTLWNVFYAVLLFSLFHWRKKKLDTQQNF